MLVDVTFFADGQTTVIGFPFHLLKSFLYLFALDGNNSYLLEDKATRSKFEGQYIQTGAKRSNGAVNSDTLT